MDDQPADEISDPRLWKKDGWVARVVKNEDDDGWAVEMSRRGDAEPALVSPWTMGRDKKNPKPMDHSSFQTLIKTATEVMARHEAAAESRLHRSVTCGDDRGRFKVDLDIARDEDDPHAILTAFDEATGERLRQARVSPGFKLTASTGQKFALSGHTGEDSR